MLYKRISRFKEIKYSILILVLTRYGFNIKITLSQDDQKRLVLLFTKCSVFKRLIYIYTYIKYAAIYVQEYVYNGL